MLLHLKDYDLCTKYWPSREMLIGDGLSHYAPLATPAIPLNISMNHVHITPQKKINFQDASCTVIWPSMHPSRDDPLGLARGYSVMLRWTFNHTTTPMMSLQWKMASSYVVRLLSSLLQKGTRCYSLYMKATKKYPNANIMPTNVFIGLALMETSNMLLKHVLPVSSITHRNHMTAAQANPSPWMPMATPWSWFHALQWQWVPHHHWLLLKDALHL